MMGETSREEIHIGDVLRLLSADERASLRKLESVKKKIINASFAVIFNRTCIYIYRVIPCQLNH